MKLPYKLVIFVIFLFSVFLFSTKNASAATYFTSPAEVNDSLFTFTLSFYGSNTDLNPSERYFIADTNVQGVLEGTFSKIDYILSDPVTPYLNSNGQYQIDSKPICGGKDSDGVLRLTKNCDPNKNWLHPDHTYHPTLYKYQDASNGYNHTNLTQIDLYIAYFKPTLDFQSLHFMPGVQNGLAILGTKPPIGDKDRNSYYIKILKSDGTFVNQLCPIANATAPVGPGQYNYTNFTLYDPGNYVFRIYTGGYPNCTEGHYLFEQGVTVNQNGGNTFDSGPRLTVPDPKTPITSSFTTLPWIVIEGLTPNWQYKIDLGGSWGSHTLKIQNGSNIFTADGTGKLAIGNICNNGEASRTDCGDKFTNGDYSLKVKQLNDESVAYFTFRVNVALTITGGDVALADVKSCKGGTCQTGLGSLFDDPAKFVNQVVGIAIGIAAGLAFLLLIFGGFRLAFSQGDPKAVQEGREVITSAIVGLIIIIFSVFLLKLIGIDILGLPI